MESEKQTNLEKKKSIGIPWGVVVVFEGQHELLFGENYLPSALGGCIVVHEDTDWIFGSEDYEPKLVEETTKGEAFYKIEGDDTDMHLMTYNPTEGTQV